MKKEHWRHLACFALSLAVILGGSTIYYAARESRYETFLEATQRKGLSQLMRSLSSVEASLQKAKYTTPDGMRQKLAAEIWKECSAAEAALSALPAEGRQIERLSRYVSQTGDYAHSLFRAGLAGQAQEDQWEKLSAMAEQAVALSSALPSLKEACDCGSMTFQTLYPSRESEHFGSHLAKINEGFSQSGELIYDGAYSDGWANRTAAALEGLPEAQEGALRENAVKLLGKDAGLQGTADGAIRSSIFSSGDKTAIFSQQGGYLLSYCDSRSLGEAKIDLREAVRSAEGFIKSLGLPEMRVVDQRISGAMAEITFACGDNGVTAYPDKIAVGVALDDGSVVRWDATEYLMNHRTREPAEPTLSLEEARSKLPSFLSVQSEGLTYLPAAGPDETLCWEFFCQAEDGSRVVIYLDAQTGQTVDIQLKTPDAR